VVIIQKGYGQLKVAGTNEVVAGEIILHAEGWVAVSPMPAAAEQDTRWFPNHQVAELIWNKDLATRRARG